MLGGDGGGGQVAALAHEVHAFRGGDVLEHDTQRREPFANVVQVAVDEHPLAVEDVDFRLGHLAVHQERQIVLFQCLVEMVNARRVGDAAVRVGGGPGRVQLEGMHKRALRRPFDLLHRGFVGQIEHHQRLEIHARRNRRQDALAVGLGQRHGGHRRRQVGHHDGAAEHPRGGGHGFLQHGAVAEVQVPVVRAGQGQSIGHQRALNVPPPGRRPDRHRCTGSPGPSSRRGAAFRGAALPAPGSRTRRSGGPGRWRRR